MIVTAAEQSGGLADMAVDLMDSLGGPGAALLVGLDNIFPPVPSELVLPLAGFAVSQGTMNLFVLLAWTTFGSVVGATVMYGIGAWLGRDRMRALIVRVPLMKESDFHRTEHWFLKHGTKAVFFGRLVPLFRALISLPAGVERMPLPKFLALTALGSLIWNSALVMTGYLLGASWQLADDYAGLLQNTVIGLVVAAILVFVVVRLRQRYRSSAR
jgi:membrane protein DedA with SNARE-associated domain